MVFVEGLFRGMLFNVLLCLLGKRMTPFSCFACAWVFWFVRVLLFGVCRGLSFSYFKLVYKEKMVEIPEAVCFHGK